jgi:hypothetical protein
MSCSCCYSNFDNNVVQKYGNRTKYLFKDMDCSPAQNKIKGEQMMGVGEMTWFLVSMVSGRSSNGCHLISQTYTILCETAWSTKDTSAVSGRQIGLIKLTRRIAVLSEKYKNTATGDLNTGALTDDNHYDDIMMSRSPAAEQGQTDVVRACQRRCMCVCASFHRVP